jgi:heat shock protein HtpX
LVVTVISSFFDGIIGVFIGIAVYIISLILALSPLGEWILRFSTGCRVIERHIMNRLGPLFSESLAKAKLINPSLPDDIQLFISDDKEPNAFATGRKTICLTKEIFQLSDEEIKAVFAHELAHLANKDTDLILMITVGNFLVTAFFIFYRIAIYIVGISAAIIVHRNIMDLLFTLFLDMILVGVMWLWTKIGIVLVMYSSRKNEYLADEFASNCCYGENMIAALKKLNSSGAKGLWANLASSHPATNDRIARLQELNSI